MRLPERRIKLKVLAEGLDADLLDETAHRILYVGSPEHKKVPSFLGAPKLRSDATPCPPNLKDQRELTGWLRDAVRAGRVTAFEHDEFPRYVWFVREGQAYEGRLVNSAQGTYKGYPIEVRQAPKGLM